MLKISFKNDHHSIFETVLITVVVFAALISLGFMFASYIKEEITEQVEKKHDEESLKELKAVSLDKKGGITCTSLKRAGATQKDAQKLWEQDRTSDNPILSHLDGYPHNNLACDGTLK